MQNNTPPDVLISEDEIKLRAQELGHIITRDYQDKKLLVLCVLKGAYAFCSELIAHIQVPLELDFIKASSYGDKTMSSGQVRIDLDMELEVAGKHILVVEDIVDTGLTMTHLINHLRAKSPESIKLASMLFKPARNNFPVTIDYLGFEIEDKFVIGMGLDYAGRFRELPYVGILSTGL